MCVCKQLANFFATLAKKIATSASSQKKVLLYLVHGASSFKSHVYKETYIQSGINAAVS